MKKILLIMAMGLALAGALVGCGKKNLSKMTPEEIYEYVSAMSEEEYNEYYEGLTSQEKDLVEAAMIHVELFGDSSLEEDVKEEDDVTEEEVAKEQKVHTYDAKKEIINSDFNEFKFQVDDNVIRVNFGGSITDFLNQFDKDTYVFMNEDDEEMQMDKLVVPDDFDWGEEKFYIYNKTQPDDVDYVMVVYAACSGTTAVDFADCVVSSVAFNSSYEGSIYSSKGIPLNDEKIAEDSNFTYENIKGYLESFGYEITSDDDAYYGPEKYNTTMLGESKDGMTYVISASSSEDDSILLTNGDVEHPYYKIIFTIDSKTRACNKVRFDFGENRD